MRKEYPCVEVNLSKVTHNAKEIISICNKQGINVIAVTKSFCAEKPIVEAILQGGITQIGDSRIQNLRKLKEVNCGKLLLRISMESEAYEVVKYSDVSLNSELDTIRALSQAAKDLNKVHN